MQRTFRLTTSIDTTSIHQTEVEAYETLIDMVATEPQLRDALLQTVRAMGLRHLALASLRRLAGFDFNIAEEML